MCPWLQYFADFGEGGGYYDSGYIQPLVIGIEVVRVPALGKRRDDNQRDARAVAEETVSILKFIERNWNLQPLTARSRDNFPNPVSHPNNPYAPLNSPALNDLFDMFQFKHRNGHGNGHDD